ncbi:DUF2142 domain-containing protein [Polynucleobacter paneuropaeus]|uniref:DUF2142 domain-containing protein n=1 Tax=Polynucleobacter paneuropaeus TaxID=2527775 RepID=UPI001BFEC902|nr:DUF2142 domain-containing protein [Polynucleobacter paneuropaeus]QWD49720.1 DUF2142 domain-containing protein [Polynucleobacter paneuropaeus]
MVDLLAIFAIFISGIVLTSLTPHFQSPDEFNHIKRAYLLTQGEILLNQIGPSGTGGDIDTGLLAYMNAYEVLPFRPNNKVTKNLVETAEVERWKRDKAFSSLPNTAAYMPFQYIPIAIGLKISEILDLNIRNSIYVGRIFNLFTAILILIFAAAIRPLPLAVYGILFLPMSLFQFGSANIDPISFSLSALIPILFIKYFDEKNKLENRQAILLTILILVFCSSRYNFLPILLINILLNFKKRNAVGLYLSIGSLLLITFWIYISLEKNTGITLRGIPTNEVVKYYITHPLNLLSVLSESFTNINVLKGYGRSFIGTLGWLDSPLPDYAYYLLSSLLLFLIVLSLHINEYRKKYPFFWLIVGIFCSLILLPIILLFVYNNHPTNFVDSLQGRYLIPISIFLFCLICSRRINAARKIMSLIILLLLLMMSIKITVSNELTRYYISGKIEMPSLIKGAI